MALQHLRSSTANKRPLPAGMSDGQLAVNTNLASPGLFFKDSNGDLVKVGPVHVGTTAPNASPAVGGQTGNTLGEQWLDTSGGTYVFKVWDGSAWRSETGTFVDVNGDTMTGALGIIAGTAAAPGLYISGDSNSGLYSPGADQVSITTGGIERLRIDSTGQIKAVSLGTAAAPVFSFTGDPNTGIYSPGADQVAISTGGAGRLFVDASGRVGVGTSIPGVAGEFVGSGSDGVIRSLRNIPTAILSAADHAGRISLGVSSAGSAAYIGAQMGIIASETWTPGTAHGSNIVFSTVSNGSTALSERLRITSAGLVGIGIASPDALLTVNGVGAHGLGSAAAPSFAFTGDLNTGIYSPGADQLALSTNGTGRLFVDATGKVTVNQATDGVPSINIESDNDGRSRTILRFTDTDVATAANQPLGVIQFFGSDTSGAGAGIKSTIGAYSESANGDSYLTFSTATSTLNNQERLRITSAGLVGVGTSTPSTPLNVVGKVRAQFGTGSADQSGIDIYSPANSQGAIEFLQTDGSPRHRILGDGDNGLSFDTRVSGAFGTALYIARASRNVGIGTTSPSATFVVSSSGAAGCEITPGSASASNGTLIEHYNRGTAAYVQVRTLAASHRFDIGGSEAARIDSSGRLLVGTSTARGNFSGTDTPQFQVEGNSFNTSTISVVAAQSTGGGNIELGSTGGTTVGGTGTVTTNGYLGSIHFLGGNGTNLLKAAAIDCQVDGTVSGGGANDMPGRLVFSTTADGAASPTERVRISSSGQIAVAGAGTAAAPTITKNDDLNTGIFFPAADTIAFTEGGTESARFDSSGKLLIGNALTARSAFGNIQQFEIEGTSTATSSASLIQNSNDANAPSLVIGKSRGTAVGSNTIVQAGDSLGVIAFAGADGADLATPGATITAVVDGTPGADDLPTRLVLATTADGANTSTERIRVTNDGVLCYDQAAPASYAAAATLTVGDLKTGLIQYTGGAATLTLPTGTLTEAGFNGVYTNMTFEWGLINTGSGVCTIGAGTDHTIVGLATCVANNSARFATRRTAANTFVSYRIS